MRAGCCAILLVVAAAAPASAQRRPPADTLTLIDSLIARGDVALARSALSKWTASHPASPTTDATTRAHQLYLNGVLASEWRAAEDALLSVALTHPTSAYASLALLRLGQGLLTAARGGDAAAGNRAAGYLQRLTTDYPNTTVRPQAFLWLAYAHEVNGRPADACAAATTAARVGASQETGELARQAQQRVCGEDARATQTGRETFAVQIGAFRAKESAEQLAARARGNGFDARVVTIEGGSIFRVRIGNVTAQTDAQDLADRLRGAGFETSVVNDVLYETKAR
jgi:cell division septation protein DedD